MEIFRVNSNDLLTKGGKMTSAILDKLMTIFSEFQIRDPRPDKYLEADLGLKYHERLCLRESIEERLKVIIPDDDLRRDLTMLEFAGLLSRRQLAASEHFCFEGEVTEDIVISAAPATVRRSLLDVTAWPHFLPHVRAVKVTYDDGHYQEFQMDIDGSDGNLLCVRQVRHCKPDHIAYFYPEPVSFLKHHCGEFFVAPLSRYATHLVMVQRWTRSTKRGAASDLARDGPSKTDVCASLRTHARLALHSWKHGLEKRYDYLHHAIYG
jgi:hypothetical protein